MQPCINDVTKVGQGQYVTSRLFPVFCICGPSMTLQFSPLMTVGNCRCEAVAGLAFLLLWPAANWLGYLWFEHFLASDDHSWPWPLVSPGPGQLLQQNTDWRVEATLVHLSVAQIQKKRENISKDNNRFLFSKPKIINTNTIKSIVKRSYLWAAMEQDAVF